MKKKILDIFSKGKVDEVSKGKIVVDNRERNSLVVPELIGLGYRVEWKQLPVADFLVNGVAVERKTVADFKSSIVNKRIFQQLMELRQYEKSLLIVEGILDIERLQSLKHANSNLQELRELAYEDLYSGGIHENAFRGFILSALLEFETRIVFTHNEKDTARYLDVLARKKEKGEIGIRAGKITLSKEERQQFILEGFPNVGAVKAKALLEKFGSLSTVFNASVEELEEILGKRASDFKNLLE